jgi:hypothetical protein
MGGAVMAARRVGKIDSAHPPNTSCPYHKYCYVGIPLDPTDRAAAVIFKGSKNIPPSDALARRFDQAAALYQSGKAPKVLTKAELRVQKKSQRKAKQKAEEAAAEGEDEEDEDEEDEEDEEEDEDEA